MCMCVRLAGSYQGLASPDDRYEGGGERERDSGGEKKRKKKEKSGLNLAAQPNTRRLVHTRQSEGR